MAWQSKHKYARISPRKARLIVDMIRGRDVEDALNVLKFSPNRASDLVSKVLVSAIANANEAEGDVELLHVKEAYVDEGPTIKRWRPKDRGRAHPIMKRTSHITVIVEEG
ncbi:MAG: 50S ribosomal protein L22 [Phycisphaerae bacterium]